MEYEDYVLTLQGKRMLFDLQEGWLRRATWIIANTTNASFGGKGISRYMDEWWPYGDMKMNENIIEAIKRKRERGQAGAIKISNDYRVAEAFKKLRSGGSRNKNSNRGRRKSGNQ